MDIHPWTKYEIARLRDEERLLRAREAGVAREARASSVDGQAFGQSSWLAWLRRRDASTDPTAMARPV